MKIAYFFMCVFDCFSGCLFYRFLMILGVFFRGCLRVLLVIFWNCKLVNIYTTLRRQLDFQGLAGFGSACFVLFFEVWCPDGFGNGFLMIFRWIWGLFWFSKSIKNVIDFGIDF